MKVVCVAFLFALEMLAGSAVAATAPLVDASGEFGPAPDSLAKEFPFEVTDAKARLSFDTAAALTQGLVSIKVVDPTGQEVTSETGARMTTQGGVPNPGGKTGQFRLVVAPQEAVGTWRVRVAVLPPLSILWIPAASGGGMVLVALAMAAAWKVWSRVQWRWFWVGAGVWAVGVALKLAFATLLNGPILGALKGSLPHTSYLAAGSVYIGLLTGVFEVGITLAAALIWRRMALDAGRAVAVGVGAGSFEALALGLAVGVSVAGPLLGMPGSSAILAALGAQSASTSLVWLVGPVERIIAILCQTSSRALVLMSVAARGWMLFGWAFLLMTGLDAIVGYVHISGAMGRFSMWWFELALVPLAGLSVPIILWCVRRWPAAPAAAPAPQA